MKYIVSFLLTVIFALPSFAQGQAVIPAIARQFARDVAKKTPGTFASIYIVKSPDLKWQLDQVLFAPQPVTVLPVAKQMNGLTSRLYRVAVASGVKTYGGGYISSFLKDGALFEKETGLRFSDMSRMLSYALGNSTEPIFAGYFVKDFEELHKIAVHPATGQTLEEAMQSAYEKATADEKGLFIITKKIPENSTDLVSGSLDDLYVMDWQDGKWLSYQKSFLKEKWKQASKLFPDDGARIEVKGNRIRLGPGKTEFDNSVVQVSKNSSLGKQILYAKEKGYLVYVENAFPALFPPTRDPLRFSVWFAKWFGAPLFNDVYELEKTL